MRADGDRGRRRQTTAGSPEEVNANNICRQNPSTRAIPEASASQAVNPIKPQNSAAEKTRSRMKWTREINISVIQPTTNLQNSRNTWRHIG